MKMNLYFASAFLLAFVGSSQANVIKDEMNEVLAMMSKFYQGQTMVGCLNHSSPAAANVFYYCGLYAHFGQDMLPHDGPPRDMAQRVRDAVNCTLRNFGFFNPDGTFNEEELPKIAKKFPATGDPKDTQFVADSFFLCHQKAMKAGGDLVDIGLMIFKCQLDEIEKECERREGPIGLQLRVAAAMYSLGLPNHNCDSVQVPTTMEKEVIGCLKEKEDSYNFVDSVVPTILEMGSSIIGGLSQIFEEAKKIPELKCVMKTAEDAGLIEDDRVVPEAMRDMVASFAGWKDEETRDKISGELFKCLDKYKSGDIFSNSPKVNECFMPVMTDVCGYNNDLSSKFLYGTASSEFLGAVMKRVTDYFDQSDLKQKLMAAMD